ncbi:hypothetical protein WPS_31100 [Vulcanimicrobium alpinum]|uniref:SCP domain-containing protein n=1 Tax=Vulcanimicrobium alpinum TaxID=3016050 RepID=A0AAN1XYR2_UNVUL|nr:CAP domain-containing protein [Vulcanimicrobium alpinum]BDE07834.1 hypothetical protein WPS_31100 [Vulcanimicrobium alpinum]
MLRIAAVVAALALAVPLGASASEDGPVLIAFVHPRPPQIQTGAARALFADVNAARALRGLPALLPDPQLDEIALTVAREMAARHYFGHTDPNGMTFADRLQSAGFRFRFAAENLAFDRDEPHANAALLRSPGHYANIMDAHPHRLGVAAIAAGEGEIFYVEEFSD